MVTRSKKIRTPPIISSQSNEPKHNFFKFKHETSVPLTTGKSSLMRNEFS